ncbi:MAG TPA: TetR/AcrR family transcriptional regulator [Hypericibacter adhaerens]|uniref:TetR family transcriptional regulator n=1 Tax=Hypericibacter adhaerens TaxID=2602016 RepID=A0A5J6N2R2_9PROT|nr:TetR/AcrR family transcriptional regulator [Hypericibacter adhaerens]QEX24268.1 TetR family transcriptional regulator [Hypericibacter adhaerens]HWA46058.1 TetR/AcrR family transcriptional regulator [Hypericibacter adhaerens]
MRAVDRIRQSARELFYREGIRAVGVEEIVTQAGVTKPSLYRSFPSKDELAADYLRGYEAEFWRRFDAAVAAHPGNPRAQILAYLKVLGERATQSGYRGCGLTNAAIEYPDRSHPARSVSDPHKRELRRRLTEMAEAMGAVRPAVLADGLLLLIEGTFASSQIFGPGGPGGSVAAAADALIEASLRKTG